MKCSELVDWVDTRFEGSDPKSSLVYALIMGSQVTTFDEFDNPQRREEVYQLSLNLFGSLRDQLEAATMDLSETARIVENVTCPTPDQVPEVVFITPDGTEVERTNTLELAKTKLTHLATLRHKKVLTQWLKTLLAAR